MGINDTVITSSEKNRAGPTSRQESPMVAQCSSVLSSLPFSSAARANRLWAFSTMTIAPSTIVPIVIAIPPNDIILAFRPWKRITRNAISMPIGKVMMATIAERACNRNRNTTMLTMTSSCINEVLRLSTARSIRSPRS